MEMSDPLHETPMSPHIEQLKFSKLHSPKMKSVYWRHFGFPANEDNCIITKQNVVCVLCHKVLTNHGNTTNLRAHLQYRHKDIFNEIIQSNGIRVPPRKTQNKMTIKGGVMKIKREPANVEGKPKVKVEYQPQMIHDYSANVIVSDNDEQTTLYETVVPMTYEDDEVVDTNHFTKVEVTKNDVKPPNSEFIQISNRQVTERNRNRVLDLNNSTAPASYQLHEALANLVIDEIRNIDSIYGTSMNRFVRSLCGNVTIPAMKKVETYIKELHNDKIANISEEIKIHSQIKPYSLGFEIWTNVEQKKFLSIFFNYTTEAPKYNLINQIFCTVEYNKYTAFDTLFEEFNLQNCTAAIINYKDDGDNLKKFLNGKSVPCILSYDSIVDHCIKNVMALPAVTAIMEEIKDTLLRYSAEISTNEVEIPIVCDNYPWTYFELLKFFSETLFWPEELEALVASAKSIYEILKTLSVTLDTLKGEDIPLSSMLSPITAKVLTKKMAITENDDGFVKIIKNTITDTLNKLVLTDEHLTISALLDPRFHRLINIRNFNSCAKILAVKYEKIIESQGISPSVSQRSMQNCSKTSSTNATKKSNLELFFDLTDSPVEQPTVTVPNSVENDLNRFHSDVYCSLDESPFLWWNRMGHMFGSLKHLAYQYQCVPCVVNMNYRKTIKQQILESQKRYMLTGHLIDAILFLHYN